MTPTCPKCGETFHYKGYWHPDLGDLICGECLGLDDLAEDASYREQDEDEEEET